MWIAEREWDRLTDDVREMFSSGSVCAPRDTPHGGHGGGNTPKHLLIGFVRCVRCGGPLATVGRRHGTATVAAYTCAWSRDRGVCDVTLRRPADSVDAVVLGWMAREALGVEREARVVTLVRAEIERAAGTPDTRRDDLTRELATVTRERERLVKALALVDDPTDVTREIRTRDARLRVLQAELATLDRPVGPRAWDAIEQEIRQTFADLRGALAEDLDGARRVLAALLDGERLTAEAVGTGRDRAWLLRGTMRVIGVAGLGCGARDTGALEGVPRGDRTDAPPVEEREPLVLRAA